MITEPQLYVDTKNEEPFRQTIAIPAGGDFQAALNAAQPGDEITLEAGAVFTGSFTLPNKGPSRRWIVIRSSTDDVNLPPRRVRITPAYSDVMPKLVAPPGGEPAIKTATGAHHYRFIGVEIRPSSDTFLYQLVQLGTATETSVDDLPHHIIFDRCYLHGDPVKGARRGIALNSRHTAVIDSYLADFKEVGADSQAIAGWNGPGPFKIVNNYLEGAGENVLFGGADPSIPDLVPSDIEIRRNHFFKPLSWKIGHPAYAGTPWDVKNLFELKNARRVLIEGNLFEHNWLHAQTGFAILFTVRNQNGAAPWSVVEDVTFMNNVVRRTGSGINILAYDDTYPSQQTKRILIKNNLFDEVSAAVWGGDGRLFQLLSGTADVIIDHNTAFHTGNIIMVEGAPNTGFVYTNNLTPHNAYGIIGTGLGPGLPTINQYFPGAVILRNVLVGGEATYYPPENYFPPSMADVGFRNYNGGDYRLLDTSPYRDAGTDGEDIGADFKRLRRVLHRLNGT